jgi:ABC-type nitrate/sulfonate/bicarbonate transport system substrate-binding protein
MKKCILGIALTLALTLGLAACGSSSDTGSVTASADDSTVAGDSGNVADSGTSEEKIPLTVRISNYAGTVVPYHIAVDYGFLEEAFADSPYDVSFEITNFANGAAAVEAAQAGELDILTSGDQMITTAILENGLPFKLIGNSYTNKKVAFIARAGSGITSKEDLKGSRVGTTIGNNRYIALLAFLEDNGYSIDEVEVVNLSPADCYTAFLNGDIDWTSFNGKQRESVLNEEDGVLLGYYGDYKFNECVFGVSDSFAEQYPDVVVTLVKLFNDVTEYANANPDVIREDMKKNYDSDDETIDYIINGDEEYVVDFTDEILESIQKTLHYAYTQGINSREADVSEVIDFTYLEQAGVREAENENK